MKSFLRSACLAVLAVATLAHCAFAVGWKAGVATIKITPEGSMWMAGYGARTRPASGLLNDLNAKALVLEDSRGQRIALVTVDLVGIGPDVTDPVIHALGEKFKLPRSHVAFCCSHTHSGPVVGHNLRSLHYDLLDTDQQKLIDGYTEKLKQQLIAVVSQAIGTLAPCELAWGQGTATFATNRRNNKEPDVPKLRSEGKLVGPFDHDVPVLRISDDAGQLRAVLFGYACHATVLDGYDWSSDYPGFAQSELEAKHPGCTALFFAGCGADQNPLPRRKVELAGQYGRDLAAAVERVLSEKLTPVVGDLSVGYREIALPFAQVPSREQVETDTKSSDKYVAARAKRYLAELTAGRSLPTTYQYPIQAFRLGNELLLIALGGEVVVDFAIRLKQEHGAARTWVAGYTNDVMAYIPSRRVLTEGGYEGASAMVYYGLPSPWRETVEADIVKAVEETVPAKR